MTCSLWFYYRAKCKIHPGLNYVTTLHSYYTLTRRKGGTRCVKVQAEKLRVIVLRQSSWSLLQLAMSQGRLLDFQANRSSVLTFRKRGYGYPWHRHKKLFTIRDFTWTNKTPVQRNPFTPGRLPVSRRSQNHQRRFLRPLERYQKMPV